MADKSRRTTLLSRLEIFIQDHALRIDFLLFLLVGVYALACELFPALDFWAYLVTDPKSFQQLTETLTTSAALVTGFAGVVVVFALESNSPRFRTLRIRGGKQLRSSWTSVSSSGFLALATGFLAHVAFSGPLAQFGSWMLTFGVLVLTHSSLRLLWLLRLLADTVNGDDNDFQAKQNVLKTSDLPFPTNRKRSTGDSK